jgi:hypothetical protein
MPERILLFYVATGIDWHDSRAIIFPPKDDITGDRRSPYSQSRYQGRQ